MRENERVYSVADKGVTKHAASEPLSMFYHQVVAKHATKCTSLQYYFNTFIWYLPCTEQVTKTQPKQVFFSITCVSNLFAKDICRVWRNLSLIHVTTTTLNCVYNLDFESECYCTELPSIIAIIITVAITYHLTTANKIMMIINKRNIHNYDFKHLSFRKCRWLIQEMKTNKNAAISH